MGIYDRDYAGAGSPPRRALGPALGLASPKRWEGNTWIMVVCVAIFVIDAVLSQSIALTVPTGRVFFEGVPESVRSAAQVERTNFLVPGQLVPDERQYLAELPGARALPIIDPATGRRVGMERVLFQPPLQALGHFSTGKGFLQLEVWRLVTFQFLHANLMHLLVNMIGLFFFGGLVESRLGRRLYLAFYLVCGIFGAVMYLLLNLLGQYAPLPPFLTVNLFTPLIGASAGVFGVLMAAARIAPNTPVAFMFIIPMRMSTLIYLLVGLAVLTLITSGPNAGGEAAHIGGAIAGWFFIRNAHLLGDFFDVLGPRAGPGRQPPSRPRADKRRAADEQAIDRILVKVRDRGIKSLNRRERRILEKASRSKRG